MLEIRTPELPNDTKAKVIRVNFGVGDRVEYDDCLFEIETDKVILDVTAPADGLMHKNIVKKGEFVGSEQVICLIDDDTDTYHEDVEHLKAQLKQHIQTEGDKAKPEPVNGVLNTENEKRSGLLQLTAVVACILIAACCIVFFY
jgi:2-oxoglutarate dehydrogenase E2 component (dihydrolipoamide succinyltransferase)